MAYFTFVIVQKRCSDKAEDEADCFLRDFSPENDRLNGCLDEISLEFVEREATPRLLMKLSIQISLDSHFRMQPLFSGYSVSNAIDPPFTIGFTRPSYSPNLVGSVLRSG